MERRKVSFKIYPLLLISLFVVSFVLVVVLFQRFFFVPKILMLFFFLFAAGLLGKLRIFLQDWYVFVGFLYLFDSLRGTIYIAVCRFSLPVYTTYVIELEKLLFGCIPSVELQKLLLHTNSSDHFSWFEKFSAVIHGSHFVAFLLVGFIIWLYKSDYFRFFKISFYMVIFLGLLGYFAFPTVPPWMAANTFGLFPYISRFVMAIYNMAIPDISSGFDTNPIAAMPSLHAAFPILCSLILWRIWRWRAVLFYCYALFMQFVIVFSGEHYIVDVLAGAILSVICYLASHKIDRVKSKSQERNSGSVIINQSDAGKMFRVVISGIIILFVGTVIGSYNKNQFINHRVAYNLYVPRYIDFFRNEKEYSSSFQIQLYIGSHHFLKKKYKEAIPYFERALSLSKTDQEKRMAEAGLRKSKELIWQNN